MAKPKPLSLDELTCRDWQLVLTAPRLPRSRLQYCLVCFSRVLERLVLRSTPSERRGVLLEHWCNLEQLIKIEREASAARHKRKAKKAKAGKKAPAKPKGGEIRLVAPMEPKTHP